mmetsp:Transcript_4129/g.14783  ORF Transcript_4129/g.14783 Transcript_4129/m.14783 type:complete len:253 (-) Transcript_4129:298-1056(-)
MSLGQKSPSFSRKVISGGETRRMGCAASRWSQCSSCLRRPSIKSLSLLLLRTSFSGRGGMKYPRLAWKSWSANATKSRKRRRTMIGCPVEEQLKVGMVLVVVTLYVTKGRFMRPPPLASTRFSGSVTVISREPLGAERVSSVISSSSTWLVRVWISSSATFTPWKAAVGSSAVAVGAAAATSATDRGGSKDTSSMGSGSVIAGAASATVSPMVLLTSVGAWLLSVCSSAGSSSSVDSLSGPPSTEDGAASSS